MTKTIHGFIGLIVCGLVLSLGGCRSKALDEIQVNPDAGQGEEEPAKVTGPAHIVVQHILIAFKGTVPDGKATRTKAEAEKLALEIYARAKKGEDFDALVKAYTDDEYPGIYRLANTGVAPDTTKDEFARGRLVRSFGDVGFALAVKEVGLAAFDTQTCRYGWHIIKRIE